MHGFTLKGICLQPRSTADFQPSFSSAGPHGLGSRLPLYPMVESFGLRLSSAPHSVAGALESQGGLRRTHPQSCSVSPVYALLQLSSGIAHANPGLLNLHAWWLRVLVFVRGLAGRGGHGLPGPLFWLSRGLLLALVPLASLVPGRPGESLLPLLHSSCLLLAFLSQTFPSQCLYLGPSWNRLHGSPPT